MFEVPAAKRIKRSELFENIESEEKPLVVNDEPEIGEASSAILPDYGFEYDLIDQTILEPNKTQLDAKPSAEKAEEVFAFNLFRPTVKSATSANTTRDEATTASADSIVLVTQAETKTDPPKVQQANLISIRSPSPPPTTANGDISGGFSTTRPDSTYFTSALPEHEQRQRHERFETSAISTSTLLALARTSWPGTSLPWRVLNLPIHGKQIVIHKVKVGSKEKTMAHATSARELDDDVQRSSKRPRPSKKRRQMLAARFKHRQILIDETKTKEEHEREKKNQKNRERKLKRRAKERREKTEKAKITELAAQSQVQ